MSPREPRRRLLNGDLAGGQWNRNNHADPNDPSPGPSGGYTWEEDSGPANGWSVRLAGFVHGFELRHEHGVRLCLDDRTLEVHDRTALHTAAPLSGLAALMAAADQNPHSDFDLDAFIEDLRHARADLPDWGG